MKNLNEEYEDFIRNGAGERNNSQVTILRSYGIVINDMASVSDLMRVTDHYEAAYNEIE